METKQMQIYKLHKDMLKDYATKEKNMFLYVTKKIYNEYSNTDIIYNFGKEIYKIECLSNIKCDDDLIGFLKPEEIYYKEDYKEERKYDFIYLVEFEVVKLEEGEK